MVRLIALVSHQYGLSKVKKNEKYTVSSDTAAKLLVHRGLAKYDTKEEEPKKSGKYNRRDMRAES